MKSGNANYYTSLAPFADLFEQGNPILTYHKLGRRPPRARLKGLYLSTKLFRKQLNELRDAGFSRGSLDTCCAPREDRRVVITFDDGYVNVLKNALEPLAETQFNAIQFLVADRLGQCNDWDVAVGEAPEILMDASQVREWLAAGHDIGSHTSTHPFLTQLSTARAQEEIAGSKKKLEDLFGRPIEHFCYPYGDWNPQVRDLVIAASYRTACTTDFGINSADTSPFQLKRITARYPSRNWKTLRERLQKSWRSLRRRGKNPVRRSAASLH